MITDLFASGISLWALVTTPLHAESAVMGLVFVSLAWLVVIYLISIKTRSLDIMLVFLGLVTALEAILLSNFSLQDSMAVQTTVAIPGGASPQASVGLVTGMTAGFMKIAIILVLGGVALALMERWSKATSRNSENPHE